MWTICAASLYFSQSLTPTSGCMCMFTEKNFENVCGVRLHSCALCIWQCSKTAQIIWIVYTTHTHTHWYRVEPMDTQYTTNPPYHYQPLHARTRVWVIFGCMCSCPLTVGCYSFRISLSIVLYYMWTCARVCVCVHVGSFVYIRFHSVCTLLPLVVRLLHFQLVRICVYTTKFFRFCFVSLVGSIRSFSFTVARCFFFICVNRM